MSDILTIGIVDVEKGTHEIKELTGADLQAHLAAQAQAQASEQATLDKVAEQNTARAAILNKLGLTQDELNVLLGVTSANEL